VNLLTPFSSYHLNTNFGNTEIFIVSWSLLLLVVSRPTLVSKAVLTRRKYESSGFPLGADSASASVDAPCAVIHGGPRFLWLSDAVYMIMHHRILWLFYLAHLHDHASSYSVAMPFT
jgi:hypothetical protein